jgi:hypothetical protein
MLSAHIRLIVTGDDFDRFTMCVLVIDAFVTGDGLRAVFGFGVFPGVATMSVP